MGRFRCFISDHVFIFMQWFCQRFCAERGGGIEALIEWKTGSRLEGNGPVFLISMQYTHEGL